MHQISTSIRLWTSSQLLQALKETCTVKTRSKVIVDIQTSILNKIWFYQKQKLFICTTSVQYEAKVFNMALTMTPYFIPSLTSSSRCMHNPSLATVNKWFEPRGNFPTEDSHIKDFIVSGNWHFHNLSGSYHQSEVRNCLSSVRSLVRVNWFVSWAVTSLTIENGIYSKYLGFWPILFPVGFCMQRMHSMGVELELVLRQASWSAREESDEAVVTESPPIGQVSIVFLLFWKWMDGIQTAK